MTSPEDSPQFTFTDRRGISRSSSGLVTGGADNEMRRLRAAGYSLPNSPTQARRAAAQVQQKVTTQGEMSDDIKGEMSRMRRARMANIRRTGADVSIALPKVRQPLSSLEDKGIPWNMGDPKEQSSARTWARLFYSTHDLVPLLVDIYARFPVTGLELQCFAGETEVITDQGVRRIEDLAGGAHRILTTGGRWVEAPFKDFGEGEVLRVTVQRNGRQREFLATPTHRWFVEEHHQKRLGRNSAKWSPLTWDKVDDIRDLAGQGIRHIDIAAQFGVSQPMISKIVRGHAWTEAQRVADEVRPEPGWSKKELLTTQLRPGQRLVSCYGRNIVWQMNPSPFGIAAGMVFGDGYKMSNPARGSSVTLYGDKDANLLPYFQGCTQITYQQDHREVQGITVTDIPSSFKDKPPLTESTSYLYGWLAGYFAADGTVSKKGECCLDSADKSNIEHAQAICQLLGIKTYDPYIIKATGQEVIFPDGNTFIKDDYYRLRLANESLTKSFFCIPEHKERWAAHKDRVSQETWRVISVEKTGKVERVYCPQVPGTEAFALAGNILTGNCKDSKIEQFYSQMFLDTLSYEEFLPEALGREYFISGEVTSLAHFDESLGIWASEEILNPDMVRVSRSLFNEQERVQLAVKDMVESLRNPMGTADESPSARLERTHEYCCTPETPVLTASMEWVPVRSLRVGDKIVGFDEHPAGGRRGAGRNFRETEVTATSIIHAPVYDVVTDGPRVTCTGAHMWLVKREAGNAPALTGRLAEDQPDNPKWVCKHCYQCGETFDDYRARETVRCLKCRTGNRSGLARKASDRKSTRGYEWIRTEDLLPGDCIKYLGEWDYEDTADTGYVAGIFDGEGHFCRGALAFSQKPGAVLDKSVDILRRHKFELGITSVTGGCQQVRILGGISEVARAIGLYRPARLTSKFYAWLDGRAFAGSTFGSVVVQSITPSGTADVVALSTSTQTLMAAGMFSHNTLLAKQYPEIIRAAEQDDGLDISEALWSRLVNRTSPWDTRGTPFLMRSFRTLMMEESLNAAQDAVADRLYSPLILATLGIPDMGDGEPWIPDVGELGDLREDMQAALAADFKLMVHHFGLQIQPVFGRESVPRFDQDYNRIDAKLMQAWGIGQALIMGGTAAAGTYASSALNREVCELLMKGFQKKVIRHMRKRMEVIAEAQEHYDYELKGGIRRPIYREVVEEDPETGEQRIIRRPKLLIPDVNFASLNLRDEATERQFIAQLKQMGVPVSDKTLAVNLPANFDQEIQRQTEEMVKKQVAEAESMAKVQKLCDEKNLPYPAWLVNSLNQTLVLRQSKAQTDLIEGQAEMQDQQITQMSPAGQMGLLNPPPPAPPGEEAPPEGAAAPESAEPPRNRARPEISDEMRAGAPRAAKKTGSATIRPLSVFERGPSSYGSLSRADEKRAEAAVRRREVMARHNDPTVSDLVRDPEFFQMLNMGTYQGQIEADWPDIAAGDGSKVPESMRLLQEMVEQYTDATGVSPDWR